MGKERRQVYSQELAESPEEDVGASGAENSGAADRETAEGLNAEERFSEPPAGTHRGGEEVVEAPGADRSGDDG